MSDEPKIRLSQWVPDMAVKVGLMMENDLRDIERGLKVSREVREWAFHLAAGEFDAGAVVPAAERFVQYVGPETAQDHAVRCEVVTALPEGIPQIWDAAIKFLGGLDG